MYENTITNFIVTTFQQDRLHPPLTIGGKEERDCIAETAE